MVFNQPVNGWIVLGAAALQRLDLLEASPVTVDGGPGLQGLALGLGVAW